MHRAVLTLQCCGVIGGKFLSEIDSNEYFLIKQKDFWFLNIFIYFTTDLQVLNVLQILISPIPCR